MRGISRLARELKLSTGTISRALNDKPGVHEVTRRKVVEAAQRLGYEPNQAARTLALGRTGCVGFMIDLDQEASGDSFFMGIFDGVQSTLSQHGLDLLVLPRPSRQDKFAYLDRLVRRRVVDAMIVSGIESEDPRIQLLQSADVPFVAFGRSKAPADFSWIDLDFEDVVERSVDRLVAQGHRRIALTVPFGDLNFGVVFEQAFKDALARHSIRFDPGLVFQTGLGEEDGYFLVDPMLDRDDPATAILLIFEAAAIGIYRRLGERGLRPGADLSVIGFRDEAIIRHLRPRLTCFSVSLHEIGVALSEALMARLSAKKGEQSGQHIHAKVPLELREGESDGPPAARSPGRRARS